MSAVSSRAGRPRHRADGRQGRGRMAGATLATLLGVLLLTSGLGTWSGLREQGQRAVGNIQAGSVSLSGTLQVQLHSRQPVGSRSFSSSTTCAPTAPFVECRVVTSSLAAERLIPGDAVRVLRDVTLAGNGDNLRGALVVDASALLDRAPTASLLARSSAVTLGVTRPGGAAAPVSGLVSTTQVSRAAGDFGTYQAVVTIQTPLDDAGAPWNEALWTQVLDLGSIRATFDQTS
ncbi:hypothetical protein [Nocardioides sp. CF8]|uniref:hypothetical protein n=1 Tax=Nocardioides sp. CF8 TaxID=110319 RepID=UPI0012EB696A|nr:hypothetical protein [Nocardioides sp. CF8]